MTVESVTTMTSLCVTRVTALYVKLLEVFRVLVRQWRTLAGLLKK